MSAYEMANEFAIRSTLMNTISSYIQFDNKFVNIIASILIVGVISRIMNNPTYILEYFSFDALKRWWKSSKKSITIKSTKYVSEKGGFTQSDEDRNANDKIRAITHFLHKNNLFAKHNELMVSDPPPDKNYKNDKEMLKDRKISLLPASVVKYKDIEVHYYANNRTADKDGKMSENNKEIKIYGQTPERCMEFIKMCHDEWVDEYYQDDEDENDDLDDNEQDNVSDNKPAENSFTKYFKNIVLGASDENNENTNQDESINEENDINEEVEEFSKENEGQGSWKIILALGLFAGSIGLVWYEKDGIIKLIKNK